MDKCKRQTPATYPPPRTRTTADEGPSGGQHAEGIFVTVFSASLLLLPFLNTLSSGSIWVYPLIFLVALLEGFVLTTFFVNGTIAIVAVGALVAGGSLNPMFAYLSVYLGTLAGDALSYFLATKIQNVPYLANRLQKFEKYRAPLARRPFTFTILGHLTPYLKGANAFLAGGLLSWKTWALADAIGAFCGITLFGGLGAVSQLASGPRSIHAYIGVAVLCVVVLLWVHLLIRRQVPSERQPTIFCPLNRKWKRNWNRILFIVSYPFWHPVRWVESLLRRLPTRALRRNIRMAFSDVRAGDIFLVRLHCRAPWGRWAHSAIAIDNNRFCHGFGRTITSHRLEALPIRYAIAHLRVKCDDATAQKAAVLASQMIGKRVAILARRTDQSKFSCTSLIFFAYSRVGIQLSRSDLPRVVPDDLIDSPHVEVLRIVYTESRCLTEVTA
jgi:membrane protein DedA with SNARE-associated domain